MTLDEIKKRLEAVPDTDSTFVLLMMEEIRTDSRVKRDFEEYITKNPDARTDDIYEAVVEPYITW